jgi:hypothetical protein
MELNPTGTWIRADTQNHESQKGNSWFLSFGRIYMLVGFNSITGPYVLFEGIKPWFSGIYMYKHLQCRNCKYESRNNFC